MTRAGVIAVLFLVGLALILWMRKDMPTPSTSISEIVPTITDSKTADDGKRSLGVDGTPLSTVARKNEPKSDGPGSADKSVSVTRDETTPKLALPVKKASATLSATLIERLTDIAWRGPHSPQSASYDVDVLRAAKLAGPRQGWVTTVPFKSGNYNVLLEVLDRKRRYLLKLTLAYPDNDERQGLTPLALEYTRDNGELIRADYSRFHSTFSSSEVFGTALHYKYDEFWRLVADSVSCKEVVVIRDTWGIPSQGSYAYTFNARAYCRAATEKLAPIAQMAFCHSDSDCW